MLVLCKVVEATLPLILSSTVGAEPHLCPWSPQQTLSFKITQSVHMGCMHSNSEICVDNHSKKLLIQNIMVKITLPDEELIQ